MSTVRNISGILAVSMMTGCASMQGVQGPRGPKLIGSGTTTEFGQYAEIGVEFSSFGDFVALVSPGRWASPIATGGSLSWLNPVAWSDDAGRTGRILLGEAVIAGGAFAAASGGGGASSEGGTAGSSPGSPPAPPPPPPE